MITQKDIVEFISTLYRKRYATAAPPELLSKWSKLSNAEIEKNLNGLFAHWGYTSQQGEFEINEFLAKRMRTTETPISKKYVSTVAPQKKKFNATYLIFIALLAVGAYVGYKYLSYSNLKMVYCLTDNVTLRTADGEKIGRMDLFPKDRDGVASYGKLLAADNEAVSVKFPDLKTGIMVRELFIKNDFWSYLIGVKSSTAFAASSYLTESKEEFELFKSVFKNLQQNKRENAQLKFVYRKIIVGCLRISNLSDRHIVLPCSGQYDKSFDGILKHKLDGEKYQIIAKLSDNNYYHFIGNASDNAFAKIRPLETTLYGLINNNVLDEDVVFKTSNGTTYLYGCSGEAKEYKSIPMSETNKQIKDFEWFFSF